jgi:hypothetical protein
MASVLDQLPDSTLSLVGNGLTANQSQPAWGYPDPTGELSPALSRLQYTYSVDGDPNTRIVDYNRAALGGVTAVRPPARFGALKLNGQYVSYFKEKSMMDEGWINGGFFVMSPNFLNFIKDDSTFLEREPLEKITKLKQLLAYKHHGFWQCVDTVRDLITLKKALNKGVF